MSRIVLSQIVKAGIRVPGTRAALVLSLATAAVAVLTPPAPPTAGAADVPVAQAAAYEVLGMGFTARPHVLGGDVVLETDGLFGAVRNYADPWDPSWIGWNDHSLRLDWRDVVADGDLMVATNSDAWSPPAGFGVYDISDPAAITELSLSTGLECRSAWLRDRLVLLDLGVAVIAYDLTNPAVPAFSGFVPAGQMAGKRWLTAVGDVVYFLDQPSIIRALGVGLPPTPVDLGPVATGGARRFDALVGGAGVLYGLAATTDVPESGDVELVTWACGAGGALVERDRQVVFAGPGATVRAAARHGDLLLLACSDRTVRAFGLGDPQSPQPGWSLELDADHVAISDAAIFIRTTEALQVLARTPAGQAPSGMRDFHALPRFEAVVGNGPVQLAQLRDDRSVLVPVDMTSPSRPRLEKPIHTGLSGRLMFAGSTGMMMEGDARVRFLDLADPRAPELRGYVDLPFAGALPLFYPPGVLLVYYLGPGPTVDFWDVSEPTKPQKVATLADRSPTGCDGRWLLCGSGGPNHYDDPRLYRLGANFEPELYGILKTSLWVVRVTAIVGDHLYLFGDGPDSYDQMEVYSIGSDPQLLEVRSLGMVAIRADAVGDLLLVQGNSRCQVFDIGAPGSPQLLGSFPARRAISGGFGLNGPVATVSGDLVSVLAGGLAGGPAVPAPRAPATRLAAAQPNPFNPSTRLQLEVAREQSLTVAVYDIRGRLVRELASGRFTAGRHEVAWDGRDDRGRGVASGVYLARVHGEGVESALPVTVVE